MPLIDALNGCFWPKAAGHFGDFLEFECPLSGKAVIRVSMLSYIKIPQNTHMNRNGWRRRAALLCEAPG
jgi:hypothetical protein